MDIINENTTYWMINSQSKIKSLTRLFTYLISKGIENVKFEYSNNTFILNNTNCIANKIIELSIKSDFFVESKINNPSLLSVPILNIIKDLKSYKGKKIFPNVYFIFSPATFTIHSIYNNLIQLSSITSRQKDATNTNMFKMESIVQSKDPDISFDVSIEKLNILLNNTYVKENSQIILTSNTASIIFDDAYGNQKILKCDINIPHTIKNEMTITIENFAIKDLMKYFKDNIAYIGIYINEEKITYDVEFEDKSIKFKLMSHILHI